jgi:hypothetical protein
MPQLSSLQGTSLDPLPPNSITIENKDLCTLGQVVLNTKFALEPYGVLNLCEYPCVHSPNQLWSQEQPHGRKVTNST